MPNIESSGRTQILHNKKVIKALVASDIFIEGPYTTSGGAQIPVAGYIERVFACPREFKIIVREMASVFKKLRSGCIMSCAVVGVPFADAVSYQLGVAMCPIRSQKSNHGVITHLVGTIPDNTKNIILFDDWNGGWDSIKKFYDIVGEYGVKPKYLVSLVESFEDEKTRQMVENFLEKEDLHFISFCTFRDLIDEYLEQKKINQDLYSILASFLENPYEFMADKAKIDQFLRLKEAGATKELKPKTALEKGFEIR